MLRRLLAYAIVVSLLLCVATMVLWVRSYWAQDEVRFSTAFRWRAVSARGGLFVERLRPRRRYGTIRAGYLTSPPYSETLMNDWDAQLAEAAAAGRPRPSRWTWTTNHFQGIYLQGWWVHLAMSNRTGWQFPLFLAFGPTEFMGGSSSTTADPQHVTEFWFIGHEAWVPYWLAFAILAVLPAAYVRRNGFWRARLRLRGGLCPSCGYNLTGNASGICPECGTSTTAKTLP